MIHECSPTRGVPLDHWYIEETLQFADFEIEEITRITHYSDSKQELIDLCKEKNWACYEAGNADSWFTHQIKNRNWLDRD